ncbi:MAG: hypothetical protein WBL63_22140 [Candidatus Acidiferrum sp.]
MKPLTHKRPVRNAESGYALLMIMCFLALLVLSTLAAAPTVLSSIQREREAEMVWRGQQYVRGVRMYYMKLHRFPTSLEDLTKPKTAGIRFMRQSFKDPMNKVDGSWRLIYVGPNGMLIGSVKNRTISLTGQPVAPALAGAQAAGTSSLFSSSGNSAFSNSSFGNSNSLSSSTSSANQSGGGAQGGAMGTALQNSGSATNPSADNSDSANDPSQPHSLAGSMDASNTIGGNIIGVGSKVNHASFMWYDKAKNYRQFEFIWDPSKDVRMVGRAPAGIGTPAGAPPQNGLGAPGTVNPNPAPVSNPSGIQDPNQMPPLQAPPPNQ